MYRIRFINSTVSIKRKKKKASKHIGKKLYDDDQISKN